MGRGQPKLDIACRARNWLWYWLVKCISQQSDDELDDLFAGVAAEGKRPRTFYRYRGLGSSPQDTRGYLKNGLSVFDNVHAQTNPEQERYEYARVVHLSQLWELLTDRTVAISRCREIACTLVTELGLTRIDKEETALLMGLVEEPQLLTQLGHTRPDKEALQHFEGTNDIRAIALLAALYKVALANHELPRAMALKDAAERVAVNFIVQWRPPEFLQSLLMRLLADRIFGNFWLNEDDWHEEIGERAESPGRKGSESTRRREIHAFVCWYVSPLRKAGRPTPEDHGLPIETTPALQWTRDNREMLEAWHWAAHRDQCMTAVMEDSPLEDEIELAIRLRSEAQRMKASSTSLLRRLIAHTDELDP